MITTTRRPPAVRPHTAPHRRPRRGGRVPARRLVALLIVMVLGITGIFVRLVVLQVRDATAYRELARDQRTRTITLPAARGTIFDRSGGELAMSLPAKAVFADPQLVREPRRSARIIADVLGLAEATVMRALTRPGRFVYLAREVDVETAESLQRRNLAGIGFLDESRRQYPAGPLAPQVLGFVGLDGIGLAGLELQYQEILRGRPGRQVLEADPSGMLIPQSPHSEVPAVPGDDLVLTIDREVQYQAQRALTRAVKENHGKGGSVLVMVPSTGEILAMATYPWFDPGRFDEAPPARQRNRAVTDVYEPGSVNKVITAAAALEESILTLDQTLTVPDTFQMYSKVFHDVHDHGPQTMTIGDIVAHSSNVGAIMVAGLLGKDRLYEYLTRFGLGSKSGIAFPGESAGILPGPELWSGTSMGTIPIGQGVAVTPLQMASVYATIANGGVWVQPTLVRGTVGRDGKFAAQPPPEARRVISKRTARALRRILAFAVEEGTGTQAQIPGFWVAGKTGTARKPLKDRRGYSEEFVASFVGFVPAADPAIVVAAMVDEPDTIYGGVAAAPLFREVARSALARLRVTPARKLPYPPHAAPL